jgi:4-amino-4-deoxy-L-arabinose transferase-like glycosyltransferase
MAARARLKPLDWRRSLLLIALVAVLLRLGVVLATPHYVPFGDPADYQRHAVSIAAGHGFAPSQLARPGSPSAFRPPAYPYLLGAAYAVAGTHLTLGRLIGAALGTLAVLLVAVLGRELAGRRVGLLAGALAAVFPPLIMLGASLPSESLFVPLELAVAVCLVRLVRRPGELRWALLAGALCGAAALTRTVGILFLLPAVAVAATAGTERLARARTVLATLAAAVVVLTPWTIRNAGAFHAFLPLGTQSGFTLVGQYNAESDRDDAFAAVPKMPAQLASLRRRLEPLYLRPGSIDEAQLGSKLRGWAGGFAARHPGHVLAATVLDTTRLVDLGRGHSFTTSLSYREMGIPSSARRLTTLSVWVALLVAIVGIVARVRGRIRFAAGRWWLWAIPVLALAGTVPVAGSPRYRAPADPFLLLLVAMTVAAVLERRSRQATAVGL